MKDLEKEYIKVKMLVTICLNCNEIEYQIPFLILKDEWTRLIEEGNFSLAFEEVINGYERYFKQNFKNSDVIIGFAE